MIRSVLLRLGFRITVMDDVFRSSLLVLFSVRVNARHHLGVHKKKGVTFNTAENTYFAVVSVMQIQTLIGPSLVNELIRTPYRTYEYS